MNDNKHPARIMIASNYLYMKLIKDHKDSYLDCEPHNKYPNMFVYWFTYSDEIQQIKDDYIAERKSINPAK